MSNRNNSILIFAIVENVYKYFTLKKVSVSVRVSFKLNCFLRKLRDFSFHFHFCFQVLNSRREMMVVREMAVQILFVVTLLVSVLTAEKFAKDELKEPFENGTFLVRLWENRSLTKLRKTQWNRKVVSLWANSISIEIHFLHEFLLRIFVKFSIDFESKSTILWTATEHVWCTYKMQIFKSMLNSSMRLARLIEFEYFIHVKKIGCFSFSFLWILNFGLEISLISGNVKAVKDLIVRGTDLNVHFKDGKSPIYIAAENGNRFSLQVIMAFKLNFLTTGNFEVVTLLLQNGINPNIRTWNNSAPLHIASEKGEHRMEWNSFWSWIRMTNCWLYSTSDCRLFRYR